jgi:hypothetical protein
MNSIIDFLGLRAQNSEITVTYPTDLSISHAIDLKRQYLMDLESEENLRQNIIESKTSQLIGQTGIIFSLLSLFIPTYGDKFKDLPIPFQIFILLVFVLTMASYLLTIFHATKYLNVKKYFYGRRSINTIKASYLLDDDFKREEIRDLVYIIERNTKVNNLKAGDLIFAFRSFKIANIFLAILVATLISFVIYLNKPDSKLLTIKDPIEVKELYSTINELRKEISAIKNMNQYILDSVKTKSIQPNSNHSKVETR